MSRAGGAARAFLSIGEVLAQLRPEFPDITISKIRYLESEGLIHPERTPSSYRKFSHDDIGRLRYILGQQRDHYLPLKVIKEQLQALDQGIEVSVAAVGGTRASRPTGLTAVSSADFARERSDLRLSRAELCEAAGLDEPALAALEQFGLIAAQRPGGPYDADALVVATTVAEMARFGIEPRHLRSFRAAADREVGLFEQVLTPLNRQRTTEARARADETARELAALSLRLHAALVKIGLRRELGR